MKRKRRRSHVRNRLGHWLETFSLRATEWAGTSIAFGTAAAVIVLWIASGPLFGFSDTWQLVINTGTTIVTFLMVFLIQRAQNKESRIVQLKLSEIVAALPGANNQLIDVDSLSEAELATLHRHFHTLARLAEQDADVHQSHSIDEAERRHEAKSGTARKERGRTSN
jgi:low affinity Fe/Cu permease